MESLGTPAGRTRYSYVAMILHWAIAIGVIANWRIADAAEDLPKAEHNALMGTHFAIGITILALTLARIAWRLVNPPPPLSASLAPWERVLARTVHGLFYVLLLALPLGGWLAFSMFGNGVNVFGLFTLPALPVGHSPDTGKEILEAHGAAGKALIILVGLHLLAVIKHMAIDRDGNLWRMLPFGTPRG